MAYPADSLEWAEITLESVPTEYRASGFAAGDCLLALDRARHALTDGDERGAARAIITARNVLGRFTPSASLQITLERAFHDLTPARDWAVSVLAA